jgi:hypothetical protein
LREKAPVPGFGTDSRKLLKSKNLSRMR